MKEVDILQSILVAKGIKVGLKLRGGSDEIKIASRELLGYHLENLIYSNIGGY